ncbi:MAG: hypothetical protein HYZ42_18900, partial [Bacteroidetes bacterium]|nr:hypothetical protein [Bacteroidota bacterium]
MKIISPVVLVISAILLISCGGSSGSFNNDRPKTPEELRAELKHLEEIDPLMYLEDNNVKMTPMQKKIRNGGLFRDPEYAPDGAVFKGEFINKASTAKFKDIQVKISFYSQTKTLIKEESYIIYEYFPPNSTKNFSFKVTEIPESQESFGFEIIGATPTN